MRYAFILFDLDGTLTDSGPGILNALDYAFDKLGLPRPELSVKRRFIGPPLMESFQTLVGMDENGARQAIEVYREYYRAKGIYENEPYPGVPALLDALKSAGKRLAVASTKPESMCRVVLKHFGLDAYFDAVCGSTGDDQTKAEVVRRALDALGADPAATVMIGDREHDVVGAHACGIPCVGVTYGYALPGEFERCGADRTADTPDELRVLLTGSM